MSDVVAGARRERTHVSGGLTAAAIEIPTILVVDFVGTAVAFHEDIGAVHFQMHLHADGAIEVHYDHLWDPAINDAPVTSGIGSIDPQDLSVSGLFTDFAPLTIDGVEVNSFTEVGDVTPGSFTHKAYRWEPTGYDFYDSIYALPFEVPYAPQDGPWETVTFPTMGNSTDQATADATGNGYCKAVRVARQMSHGGGRETDTWWICPDGTLRAKWNACPTLWPQGAQEFSLNPSPTNFVDWMVSALNTGIKATGRTVKYFVTGAGETTPPSFPTREIPRQEDFSMQYNDDAVIWTPTVTYNTEPIPGGGGAKFPFYADGTIDLDLSHEWFAGRTVMIFIVCAWKLSSAPSGGPGRVAYPANGITWSTELIGPDGTFPFGGGAPSAFTQFPFRSWVETRVSDGESIHHSFISIRGKGRASIQANEMAVGPDPFVGRRRQSPWFVSDIDTATYDVTRIDPLRTPSVDWLCGNYYGFSPAHYPTHLRIRCWGPWSNSGGRTFTLVDNRVILDRV